MREIFRSRVFKIAAITLGVIGLYAWFGFQIAPKIVRSQAIKFVHKTYGRELKIGQVRVQPFWLQLEIRDLSFPDADGKPMLSFQRFFADFELSSIWHRAYVFKELSLEAPGIRTVVRPNGVVNLADLSPKTTEPPPPPDAKKSGLPSLWIQLLAVSNGNLGYQDLSRRVPYTNDFHPVAFTLRDFKTTPQGGGFSLSAESEAKERFDWKGRFQLAPVIGSQGDFTIAALQAPGVAKFLGDALPFGLSSGLIDMNGSYQVSLGEKLDLKLQLAKLGMTGLALRAHGVDADWIEVPGIELANVAVAMPENTVKIDSLGVQNLKAQCWLNPDRTVNLMQLFAPAPNTTPVDTMPSAAKAAKPSGPQNPWALSVAKVDVLAANIALEDRMQAPVKKFAVTPVNLHVENASLDLAKPLPVRLDALINGHALVQGRRNAGAEPPVGRSQGLARQGLAQVRPALCASGRGPHRP